MGSAQVGKGFENGWAILRVPVKVVEQNWEDEAQAGHARDPEAPDVRCKRCKVRGWSCYRGVAQGSAASVPEEAMHRPPNLALSVVDSAKDNLDLVEFEGQVLQGVIARQKRRRISAVGRCGGFSSMRRRRTG